MSNVGIRTRSGLWFDLIEPRPASVHIEDIAHALAINNRFTGHTDLPYSVAEHCVRMSHIVPEHLALDALMHDVAEAYTSDMSKPLKDYPPMAAVYKPIEARIEAVCRGALGIPGEKHSPEIREYDNIMVVTEGRDLGIKLWALLADAKPLDGIIYPWYWARAESKFLIRYNELTK